MNVGSKIKKYNIYNGVDNNDSYDGNINYSYNDSIYDSDFYSNNNEDSDSSYTIFVVVMLTVVLENYKMNIIK